jgi:hypothetical protein
MGGGLTRLMLFSLRKKLMSRQLYIPRLKDELVLAEDWTFTLFHESRNYQLIAKLDPDRILDKYDIYRASNYEDYPKPVTMWAATVLIVDRIYIRQNQANYDSVTFRVKSSPQRYEKARFWAKLDDVNRMVIENDI